MGDFVGEYNSDEEDSDRFFDYIIVTCERKISFQNYLESSIIAHLSFLDSHQTSDD